MAEAHERVHKLAFQGLSAAEIERRLDYELTATERELLRDIARHEVESAHRQEPEVATAPHPPSPEPSDRDHALSALSAWRYTRRTRPALATALVVLAAVGVGALIGSLLTGKNQGARHNVETSATRAPKPGSQDQRSTAARRSASRPRATRSAPGPGRGKQTPSPAQPNLPVNAARAARLNDDGFKLMNAGRYNEAIPLLQRAVSAFPPQSTDLTYAYALYNLGRSLRLAGRPEQAIPLLERRLQIDNQRGTVTRELTAARRSGSNPGGG